VTWKEWAYEGSDLLISAVENDGVERIFGIPGE
jgi:thiamine pyrophosphate-dependent acetolactate synthase large subunit-like protein